MLKALCQETVMHGKNGRLSELAPKSGWWGSFGRKWWMTLRHWEYEVCCAEMGQAAEAHGNYQRHRNLLKQIKIVQWDECNGSWERKRWSRINQKEELQDSFSTVSLISTDLMLPNIENYVKCFVSQWSEETGHARGWQRNTYAFVA